MSKTLAKYIDKQLMKRRQATWKKLYKQYGLDDGVQEFLKIFNSYPTPTEYKSTGLHAQLKHVYFITDGEYVKIGISQNTRGRLDGLQTSNPRPLRIAGVVPYGGLERELALHRMFKDSRVKGEWFKVTDKLKDYIAYTAAYNYETFGNPFSQCVTGMVDNREKVL